MSSPNVNEMKEKAYRLCREYLSGSWKIINSTEMVFQPISGGLSNLLYFCGLPKHQEPLGMEPRHVLLRLHGQPNSSHPETMLTDTVVFALLSERKLGPRLYGVFPGGRLEEYIPARCLLTPELKRTDLSQQIARKLGHIHSLEVPIKKGSKWLFSTMDRWLECVRENLRDACAKENLGDRQVRHHVEKIMSFAIEKELDWLKKTLIKAKSPIVFSHNDLQEGNILTGDIDNDKLVFIDFEYCSYNYRGFDLANHFCEWCFDYKVDSPPFFAANLYDFPTKDEQLTFIRSYIKSLSEEQQASTNEKQLLHEVTIFVLASHFLWGLWSIINAQKTSICFGYWDYAVTRFDAYFQHKPRVISELKKRKNMNNT